MTKWEKRAIHTAVATVWGKAKRCEICYGANKSKRFEWSNTKHTYTLERKDWRELCATCHRRYDRATFGVRTWNKGMKKERPTMVCEWCAKLFIQQRSEQILCSTKCAGHRNGNITKRKYGDLIENKLLAHTTLV